MRDRVLGDVLFAQVAQGGNDQPARAAGVTLIARLRARRERPGNDIADSDDKRIYLSISPHRPIIDLQAVPKVAHASSVIPPGPHQRPPNTHPDIRNSAFNPFAALHSTIEIPHSPFDFPRLSPLSPFDIRIPFSSLNSTFEIRNSQFGTRTVRHSKFAIRHGAWRSPETRNRCDLISGNRLALLRYGVFRRRA